MTEFQFVPVQTNFGSESEAKAKKFVRSTAMRAFRKRERQKRVQEHLKTGNLLTKEASFKPLDACMELKTAKIFDNPDSQIAHSICGARASTSPSDLIFVPPQGLCETPPSVKTEDLAFNFQPKTPHSPVQYTLESGFDTFDQLGLCTSTNIASRFALFKHFVNVIAPALQTLGVNSDKNPFLTTWAYQALQEPAMMEAILFHSSVHLDGLHKRPWTPATLNHRGESIRLVNELLQSPDPEISDASIVAVGLLGSSGNITGDHAESKIHKNGLKMMVETKGGLAGLGMDSELGMLLALGDILSSTLTLSKPLFAPSREETLSLEPEAELHHLFREISILAAIHDTISTSTDVTKEEILSFNQQRTSVEQRLLSFELPSSSNPEEETQNEIFAACRIATLVCTNLLFRELSPLLFILTSLQNRLISTLVRVESMISTPQMTVKNTEMLLWIVFVGGMVAETKEWFADGIVRIMECLDLHGWGDLEACLGRHLWPKRMRNERCARLWEAVQAQQVKVAQERDAIFNDDIVLTG